jgi:hypothetical protein
LTLQFDEHQNDAGAMTRCEAYLDSKGFLRWWAHAGTAVAEESGQGDACAAPTVIECVEGGVRVG